MVKYEKGDVDCDSGNNRGSSCIAKGTAKSNFGRDDSGGGCNCGRDDSLGSVHVHTYMFTLL